jgi:hypothetical protein
LRGVARRIRLGSGNGARVIVEHDVATPFDDCFDRRERAEEEAGRNDPSRAIPTTTGTRWPPAHADITAACGTSRPTPAAVLRRRTPAELPSRTSGPGRASSRHSKPCKRHALDSSLTPETLRQSELSVRAATAVGNAFRRVNDYICSAWCARLCSTPMSTTSCIVI